jgi:hypothetical protein
MWHSPYCVCYGSQIKIAKLHLLRNFWCPFHCLLPFLFIGICFSFLYLFYLLLSLLPLFRPFSLFIILPPFCSSWNLSTDHRGLRDFSCPPADPWMRAVQPCFLYKLTPWRRVLIEKAPVAQLLKSFLTLYGTRRFITVVTRARHYSLSWEKLIQYISPHPVSIRCPTNV